MSDTNGIRTKLSAEIAAAGGPAVRDPADAGSVGRTLFDLPGSSDLAVTVLLPNAHLHEAPAQSLVRIVSRADGRKYLGVVSAGPFAEPDGLRGDSPMLQAVATHGGDYLPPFHGRVQVTLLGEETRRRLAHPAAPTAPAQQPRVCAERRAVGQGPQLRRGRAARPRGRARDGRRRRAVAVEGRLPPAHGRPRYDGRGQVEHRRRAGQAGDRRRHGRRAARRGGRVHPAARAEPGRQDARRT